MLICAHVKQDVVFRMSTEGSPRKKDGELGTRCDEASVEVMVGADRGPKGKRTFHREKGVIPNLGIWFRNGMDIKIVN